MPYQLLFGSGIRVSETISSKEEAVRRSKQHLIDTGEEKVVFRDLETGYDYGVRKVDLSHLSLNGHSVSQSQFSLVSLTSKSCCASDGGGDGGTSTPPDAISDLMLWLKADSLNLHDEDLVSFWEDSSGNGRNATQTMTALKPVYKINQLNQLPIVRFQSQNVEIINFLGGLADGEIFWVIKASPGGGFHSFGSSGRSFYPIVGTIQDDFGRSIRTPPVTPTLSIANWRLYNVGAANGGWTSTLDEKLQYNYSLAATTWSARAKIYIGRDDAEPGDFFDGDIAEVIMYDRLLLPKERIGVKNYLYNKYSIGPSGNNTSLKFPMFA